MPLKLPFLLSTTVLTYPSNGGGSVAVRHNDDDTSTVVESMLVQLTPVIMF